MVSLMATTATEVDMSLLPKRTSSNWVRLPGEAFKRFKQNRVRSDEPSVTFKVSEESGGCTYLVCQTPVTELVALAFVHFYPVLANQEQVTDC